MKSASKISMLIREKKKKMMQDPDLVDSSGSPQMDGQDVYNMRQEGEATKDLDENEPAAHAESELDGIEDGGIKSPVNDNHSEELNKMEHDEVDEALIKRKARLSKMMMK